MGIQLLYPTFQGSRIATTCKIEQRENPRNYELCKHELRQCIMIHCYNTMIYNHCITNGRPLLPSLWQVVSKLARFWNAKGKRQANVFPNMFAARQSFSKHPHGFHKCNNSFYGKKCPFVIFDKKISANTTLLILSGTQHLSIMHCSPYAHLFVRYCNNIHR